MDRPPAVAAHALTKRYHSRPVVVELDLQVAPGERYGLFGPPRSGKSTLLRMLLGLVRPTAGRAFVLGSGVDRGGVAWRARVGYLPGDLPRDEPMTGRQWIGYLGNLRRSGGGAGRAVDGRLVAELAERLAVELDRPLRRCSPVERRKVGLIQALAPRPELLLLDDPARGFDEKDRLAVAALIGEAVTAGTSLLFTSAHPDDLHLADRAGLLRSGRLVTTATSGELLDQAVRVIDARFAGTVKEDRFADLDGLRSVVEVDGVLRFSMTGSIDPLIKRLAWHDVRSVVSHEADLEGVFPDFYPVDEQRQDSGRRPGWWRRRPGDRLPSSTGTGGGPGSADTSAAPDAGTGGGGDATAAPRTGGDPAAAGTDPAPAPAGVTATATAVGVPVEPAPTAGAGGHDTGDAAGSGSGSGGTVRPPRSRRAGFRSLRRRSRDGAEERGGRGENRPDRP